MSRLSVILAFALLLALILAVEKRGAAALKGLSYASANAEDA